MWLGEVVMPAGRDDPRDRVLQRSMTDARGSGGRRRL